MVRAGEHLPIGEYAFVGDCHTAALVSRGGSIDWCCLPRFDSASTFGRLLDHARGGYCSIAPAADHDVSRRYVDDTLVLVTTFSAAGGVACVYDCLVIGDDGPEQPERQVLRIVEGVRGRVDLDVVISARFDYGEVKPLLRRHGPTISTAIGGDDALIVSGDLTFEIVDRHDLRASVTVEADQRVRLLLEYRRPEHVDPDVPVRPSPRELDDRLTATIDWWQQWAGKVELEGPYHAEVRRSAVVLKALVNAPTGAIVAAPTTSLPEVIGHDSNWDYRYSWVRDSQFTVRSLTQVHCATEADAFRRFIERSAAGSADGLQIMYGAGGERRLAELELDLDGYCGSRPVRIGNAAAHQQQHDVYGYLLDLAWRWHERGRSPDDDYWRFVLSLVDTAIDKWREPDCGIWEMRGRPQHFVHSKVMCWTAVDRGIRLAESCLRQAPIDDWRAAAREMREAIETRGYDDERGIFVQTFDDRELDAALLLLPAFDFVAYDDERMIRTTDAIRDELGDDGLLRRTRVDDGPDDGPGGREGAFVACSFWLVECLAHQGRPDEAREVFNRAVAAGNDLGLFAEEFDPETDMLLGNFPQGLSHLSHIAAAVALTRAS